ncbi:MAG: hypothetical protein ACE5LQ_06930 [Candidatus Bipolaricaulia bacterium]
MCRMIAAVGRFPAERLLAGLLLMAQDQSGLHELSEGKQGNFQHGDGWGLVCRVHPRYYTLHIHHEARGLLISSEPLPGFSGWEALENGTALRLGLQ